MTRTPTSAGTGVPLGRVLVLLAVATLVAAGVAVGALVALTEMEEAGTRNVWSPATGQSDGYAVWARDPDGRPLRWDPCTPVPLVVNPDGAPPGAVDDVHEAAQRVAEATGLRIAVEETVDERPSAERGAFLPERYGDRWAPVLVAWSPPSEGGLPLRTMDRGLAVPVAVGEGDSQAFVSGQIVLNARRGDLQPGFDDRATSWGATLLHELGHLVGLDHADDPTQLMHRLPGHGPVGWGEGDRAGLAAVGAGGGCLDVPEPTPVEVEISVVR